MSPAPSEVPTRPDVHTRPDARRRRFRLAAVALPFVLVALAEGGLRLGGFHHDAAGPAYLFRNPEARLAASGSGPTVPDAQLFWRMRPGFRGPGGEQHVASNGYREAFRIEKAPGVRRIVCLGDSSTFGLQVAAPSAWPAALERRLATRGGPVDVLNLGVPGYTSHQGLELLRRDVPDLRPDVVIAAFGAFNDWVPAVGRTDAEQGTTSLWTSLRVVQALAWLVGARAPEGDANGEILDTIDTRALDGPRRVGPGDFSGNLRGIVGAARAQGADVVLLALPLPQATADRNPIAHEYRRIGRETATDLGLPFVDGWQLFATSGLGDAALFADFCHPSARGHALIADAVSDALSPR